MLTKIIKITHIKKRTGEVVEFNKNKIRDAIYKAMKAVDEVNESLLDSLVEKVVLILESKYRGEVPSVEDVQDVIEFVLMNSNLPNVAKEYILYREERRKLRETTQKTEDSPEIKLLKEKGINTSKQAIDILNNSQQFSGLGKIIFLDRYSLKTSHDDIKEGDLVVTLTKEDPKFPRKDIGVVKKISEKNILTLYMLTGPYADPSNNFEFEIEKYKCEKPIESADGAYRRVAKAVASVEKEDYLKQKWYEIFYSELKNQHIQPAGRIMAGANVGELGYTSKLTLYNCYVLPSPEDSREGIIDQLKYMTEIFSRGGGCGFSLSSLRPKYAFVKTVQGRSSGAVSFGDLYSYMAGLIEQGGSRRGALMLMLNDWHPDILEFISAKKNSGILENANISILISDAFMKAVKNNEIWNLEFPDYENERYYDIYNEEWDGDLNLWKSKGYPTVIYKTINARELWDKIITSVWESAEPGVVFIDRYNKLSNSYYYNKIVATNPCGEQGLPPWGVCNLGHLYLSSFLDKIGEDEEGPVYQMNWDRLKYSARILTRFLDNIIDLTPYFYEKNKRVQKAERRIGGGTLGLAELLIKLRIKYGSPECMKFIDKLYMTITCEMYSTSSQLALEKGVFPKFDAEKFLASGFMMEMPKEIREKIKQNGIRNVCLVTQAPTGTVGTMLGTSTGIEPYYAFKYYRQSRLGFYEENVPIVGDYLKNNKLPDYFVTAMDLTPEQHVKTQAAIQRWTDSSISKTVNVPANFTIEDTKKIYELAYDLGCKGITVYRDSSRDAQVLTLNKEQEKKNEESSKKRKSITAINEQSQTKDAPQQKIGTNVGDICPNCKKGTIVKVGGCTQCSLNCGYTGSCDLHI